MQITTEPTIRRPRRAALHGSTAVDTVEGPLLVTGDDRVKPNIIPAGRYAELTYTGRNNAYKGNKALVEWARDNGVAWDRWDDPRGDTFRCRYESYLSDRLTDPDKATWRTNVAIKINE